MFQIITQDSNEAFLRKKCQPVTKFDSNLSKLIDEMEQTMVTPDKTGLRGVGIAANQVGVLQRILILTLNYETKKKQKILAMINPKILELSPQKIKMEEGCLSVPKKFGKISRASKVKVQWQNRAGEFCEKKLEKWDARIFLHEYDHLEGKLFTDYL